MGNSQLKSAGSTESFPTIAVKTTDGLEPIRRQWDGLMNVRNLINELEQCESDFELIGSLQNEDLPENGEFFLSLTVKGDGDPIVTKIGLENGRLFMLLSEDSRSSQLAVLELQ